MSVHSMYVFTVSMKKEYKIISKDEKKIDDILKNILSKEENFIIDSAKVTDLKIMDTEITKPS